MADTPSLFGDDLPVAIRRASPRSVRMSSQVASEIMALKALGYSHVQIAQKLNIKRSRVCEVVNGHRFN